MAPRSQGGATGPLSRAWRAITLPLIVAASLLAGCAGAPKYTTDDGRRVNEQLLEQVRRYGQGERALRPAIARTAALADPDCDKQWELPFSVATAESWDEDDRVAWVRALGVDERLTVVASAPGSPLEIGERIVALEGGGGQVSAEQMSLRLVDLRDQGRAFDLTVLSGRRVRVQPFEVCRGYTRLAPPSTPQMQDYHWLLTMHPLSVVQPDLTEDEALWMVLWTQGLSEEGGARMKTFHYTTKIVGTLYSLATLASGFKGAAMAADAAIKAAQTTATRVATDFLRQQLVDRARDLARQTLATQLVGQVKAFAVRQMGDDPSGGLQVLEFMQGAAEFRRSFSGLSRVAATVFDRADAWAFERAAKLHANPLAGFSLHQKLLEQGVGGNAFAFDVERLGALSKTAEARGMGDEVVAILKGVKPSAVEFALTGMPLATASRPFRYEDAAESSTTHPFAFGLVDAMMSMPVESRRRP